MILVHESRQKKKRAVESIPPEFRKLAAE